MIFMLFLYKQPIDDRMGILGIDKKLKNSETEVGCVEA